MPNLPLFMPYPSAIFNLIGLAVEIETLDTYYEDSPAVKGSPDASPHKNEPPLSRDTKTAVVFLSELAERVTAGKQLDPEQELLLAFAKYIAGIAILADSDL
jgi:hypothetical protein